MSPWRRQFLVASAGLVAVAGTSTVTCAQEYPSRPVRIMVGSAAGASPDIHARNIGQWLSNRLGQPFIVENRPGAGNGIATDAVARAQPDGHTLLMITASHTINTTLMEKQGFNFVRGIAPVASITRQPSFMVVHPSVPAKSVPEFIAYAKANPGKLNMASAGNGSGPHLYGELFKMLAGIDLVHVPYRGGSPAFIDLISGHVQVMFNDLSAVEQIKAGQLRALAVSTAGRSKMLPDIPFLGDFVPGYESSAVFGIGTTMGTPVEIIETINREINAGLADAKIMAGLALMDGTAIANSPAEYGAIIATDIEKWKKVIEFAKLKPN